jgi:hypothetical protein
MSWLEQRRHRLTELTLSAEHEHQLSHRFV